LQLPVSGLLNKGLNLAQLLWKRDMVWVLITGKPIRSALA